jgi:HSP20 family molecular chaperone IbpA
MARSLTLKMAPVDGTLERFYAFVDSKKRICHDGDSERSWTGSIDDADTRIKVRVFGIGNARYRLTIDLPGTANDQTLELRLDGGYGELELRI